MCESCRVEPEDDVNRTVEDEISTVDALSRTAKVNIDRFNTNALKR